jgi:hypothetical protein
VALRLHQLASKSLWIDEVISFNVAQGPFFSPLSREGSVIGFCLNDTGPGPLAYAAEWVALHLRADERALRWPTALFGCVGLVVFWRLLALLIACERAQWLGLALWVSFEPQVAYAQDARGYALATLLCLLSLTAAVRLWLGGRWLWWWAVVVLQTLAFFTSYFSAIQFGALVCGTLWARGWAGGIEGRGRRLLAACAHVGGGFALFLIPSLWWLSELLPRAFHRGLGTGGRLSSLVPTSEGWTAYGRLWGGTALDLVGRRPQGWPPAAAISMQLLSISLWAGFGIVGLVGRGLRRPWPLIWPVLGLGPLLLVTVLATGHFLAPRYLFFVHAPAALLVAWGIEVTLKPMERRRRALAGTTAILGVLILGLAVPRMVRHHTTEKADWRSATEHLLERSRPGDIIVGGPNADLQCVMHCLVASLGREGWGVYFDPATLPGTRPDDVLRLADEYGPPPPLILWDGVTTPAQLNEICSVSRRVWFVTAHWGFAHRSAVFWALVGDRFEHLATFEGRAPVAVWLFDPSPQGAN